MVDAQGLIGWAPASYLVPVNETDLEEEAEENENLIEQERGKLFEFMIEALYTQTQANHSPALFKPMRCVFSYVCICMYFQNHR